MLSNISAREEIFSQYQLLKRFYHIPTTLCVQMYHVPRTVYHVPRTGYYVPCTVYHVPCTVYRVSCTMYHVPCFMYLVLCTMYYVPGTLYFVQYHFIETQQKSFSKWIHQQVNSHRRDKIDPLLATTKWCGTYLLGYCGQWSHLTTIWCLAHKLQ